MILQSLVNFYEMMHEQVPGSMPDFGWSAEKVHAELHLTKQGELRTISPVGDNYERRHVPVHSSRSGQKPPACFLCDNASYLLGYGEDTPAKNEVRFNLAKNLHLELLEPVDSPVAQAICRFFLNWDYEKAADNHELQRCNLKKPKEWNFEFYVEGMRALDDELIRAAWEEHFKKQFVDAEEALCFVTGEITKVALHHYTIKGVPKATNPKLISFKEKKRAFESYGKKDAEGLNAPISIYAAHAYAAALNYLLYTNKHHVYIGDTAVVYWAEGTPGGTPDIDEILEGAKDIHAIWEKFASGKRVTEIDIDVPFHVLALAPRTGRISVEFYLHNTFGEILHNLLRHYGRVYVSSSDPHKPAHLNPYNLLFALKREETEKKAQKKSKKDGLDKPDFALINSMLRSILEDLPYPPQLYKRALFRALRTPHNPVSLQRAGIIKACLLKNFHRDEQEVTMALNEERTDTAYVLGRLFAVYEKTQKDVSKEIKSTIKSRYFDSACSKPSIVFPELMKLHEKHLDKLASDPEKITWARDHEKRRNDLVDRLEHFPKRLTIEEQGDFMLGYYQQFVDFYKKKDSEIEEA